MLEYIDQKNLIKELMLCSINQIKALERPTDFKFLPHFSKEKTSEILKGHPDKCYVYALLRQNGLPFYIGKGKQFRALLHKPYALKYTKLNLLKDNIIRKMSREGLELNYYIFRFFEDSKAAPKLEEKLIAFYGRTHFDSRGILSNWSKGGEKDENLRSSAKHSILIRRYYQTHPEKKEEIGKSLKEHGQKRKKVYLRCSKLIKKYNIPVEMISKCRGLEDWLSFQSELLKIIKNPGRSLKDLKEVIGNREPHGVIIQKFHTKNPDARASAGKKTSKCHTERSNLSNECLELIQRHDIKTTLPLKLETIKVWKLFKQKLLEMITNPGVSRKWRDSAPTTKKYRESALLYYVKHPEAKEENSKRTKNHHKRRKVVYTRCIAFIEKFGLSIQLPSKKEGLAFWQTFEQKLLKLKENPFGDVA